MNVVVEEMDNMGITPQLPEGCILKGYLVTHPDGFEARLGPDRARAEAYVSQHQATRIEPLFVFREADGTQTRGK